MFQELTVGERLKMARKAKGMLQEEVGKIIKVGKSQISNIEKGYGELSRGNAIVLSENLGIELDWLLTGGGKAPAFVRPTQQDGNYNTNTQTIGDVGASRAEKGASMLEQILSKQLEDLQKRYDRLEDKYDRLEAERDQLREDNFKMALELSELKFKKE